MERVQEELGTIEIYENDIQMYLKMFCEENDINYLKKESQAVWNSCLHYIHKRVFKGTDKLKSKRLFNNINNNIQSNCNMYDYEMLLKILDIYAYDMCMCYDKEISIIGFSILTGINQDTIHDWGKDVNKLSSLGCDIYKKLRDLREESLSNKLVTGKQNPVGVLGVLNRHYQWNMPGVSREQANKSVLTAAELPKLSDDLRQSDTNFNGNITNKLCEKNTQFKTQ